MVLASVEKLVDGVLESVGKLLGNLHLDGVLGQVESLLGPLLGGAGIL
jgi:hypothetical protein